MKDYLHSLLIILFFTLGLTACGGGSSSNTPNKPPPALTLPGDTYFSLAVTENSHNHTGARLLFLDFQDTTPNSSVIQNNIVISPKIANGAITLDGSVTDWDTNLLTTVNGQVQNNYPLSEFIDATATDITVGSVWDDNYIYFVVQWQDAGNTQSTQYKKWIFGNQGDGETNWNSKNHIGVTAGALNDSSINASHPLLGAENEDRVLIMFPMVDSENNFSANGLGCAAYCHTNLHDGSPNQNYTGLGLVSMHTNVTGDTADIWHWKSSRTAPSNRADDKHLVYAVGGDSGRKSDSGSSAYSSNSLSGNNPGFMHNIGLTYTGDFLTLASSDPYSGTALDGAQIPAVISRSSTGSRGDVETRASFSGAPFYRWTVEFRRLRNTGYSDDHQFDIAAGLTVPVTEAVVTANAATGAGLYTSYCQGCHAANGSGIPGGNTWSFPRVQRASGSMILKALQTVVPMQGININQQQAADIAAYLQTQATFVTTQNLSVTVNGVTASNIVSSNPAGISCAGTCSFDFVTDSVVTLTANYINGYTFTGWDYGSCGSNQSCDVTLSSNQIVSATYTPNATTYTLNVANGGNGTVTSLPAGIDCNTDCTEVYTAGNTITLTATPVLGYQFDGWSDAGCSGTGTCVFDINSDVTVSASFSVITVPTCDNKGVIFDTNGTNGYGLQMMINEGSVSNPTDLAFIPGSSTAFLVLGQSGTVHYFNGACTEVNSINLRAVIGIVDGGTEEGLLNVEFHPDFASNSYVFFYHTNVASSVNSVSRMTVSFSGGNLVLTDPVKIIDFHKVGSARNHNGGGLVFAPDKTLLASVGDGGSGSAANAQVNTNLLGTVVRINPSLTVAIGGYTIPLAGNKFNAANAQCTSTSSNSANCPEILANGLRNPYRMSIDGNIIYLGEVGQGWEEINSFDYTDMSLNFGWNTYDGTVNQSGFRDPILTYQRSDTTANTFRSEDPACPSDSGCTGDYASVITGDVYRGALYGGELTGRLLHAEFMDGFTRAVSVNASGDTTDSGMHLIHHDGISAMIEGPDGYIYIATQRGFWGTGDANIVYRLVKP